LVETSAALTVTDGEVYYRTPEGQVTPLRTPTGMDPKVFRRVLATVDILYRRTGKLPTVHEAYVEWPRIPKKTYGAVFATDEFRDALTLRGITYDDSLGLTEEQMIAIMALTDPTEQRSTKTVLAGMGIPMPKYQAWMRNAQFSREYERRSEENTRLLKNAALQRLNANVDKGDQRAVEFALALTGRYSPNQAAVQDAMAVVNALLEAVQKHVNPETMSAILKEIKTKATSYDLTHGDV
jgi:hypothetical protein